MIIPGFPITIRQDAVNGGLPAGTTWNPLDKSPDVVLTNGNLTFGKSSFSSGSARATAFVSSGRVYWEVTSYVPDFNNQRIGIGKSTAALSLPLGADSDGYGYNSSGGVNNNNTNIKPTAAAWGTGDIIGIALDMDLLRLYVSKNGVWQSSDPAAGTGFITISAGSYSPMVYSAGQVNTLTANFNGPFAYPVPAGFN